MKKLDGLKGLDSKMGLEKTFVRNVWSPHKPQLPVKEKVSPRTPLPKEK